MGFPQIETPNPHDRESRTLKVLSSPNYAQSILPHYRRTQQPVQPKKACTWSSSTEEGVHMDGPIEVFMESLRYVYQFPEFSTGTDIPHFEVVQIYRSAVEFREGTSSASNVAQEMSSI
ncbi:uncharacterized protein LOC111412880 isoform X3 [Olea europaea var. sylvestris]|uniref:uncharacterized protein LOC111412880 isoform X3 n=1 Tax=Olea europaea var. sylvestris TaxID=158386 RepID=UPI000C1D2136|nr:uncharacterized protein LOC111412880 isoform X3 [Olea europaea var. sylvestris]